MADEVTLLDCWASVGGMRCRIALAEKEIQYEYKEEDIFERSSFLLQSNPINKTVPVLIHNGKPINGKHIILEYIDETWNDKAPLMPSDPYSRARARFRSRFADRMFFKFARTLWEKTDEAKKESDQKEFIKSLRELEEELGDKSFFGGEAFGFLDLAIVPIYSWFHTFEKFGTFSIESECPKFIAWAKRCLERESVSKTLPNSARMYDYVVMLRDKVGVRETQVD